MNCASINLFYLTWNACILLYIKHAQCINIVHHIIFLYTKMVYCMLNLYNIHNIHNIFMICNKQRISYIGTRDLLMKYLSIKWTFIIGRDIDGFNIYKKCKVILTYSNERKDSARCEVNIIKRSLRWLWKSI